MKKKISSTYVAIDFETATYSRNSACALGAVKVRDGRIIEKHYWVFQPPENQYSDVCINVHGITPDFTATLPTLNDLYDDIFKVLNNSVVVSHNVQFDIVVLYESLKVYELAMPTLSDIICTCELSGKRKLNDCCAEYDIPLNHHDAMSDATACAILYLKLCDLNYIQPKISNNIFSSERKLSSEVVLAPNLEVIENKDTIFYGKKVVITGVFELYPDRERLAQTLKALGADINTSISKQTNIVIIGQGAGSKKIEKINTLIDSGYPIVIIKGDAELKQAIENING